jgi:hypothetical protein
MRGRKQATEACYKLKTKKSTCPAKLAPDCQLNVGTKKAHLPTLLPRLPAY